jgi:predicted Zn finger-like uncharacterized protein
MILTCPDCATRYFVDDAKLGAEGRTVRCSSCGTKWKAEPEAALELVSTVEEGAVAKSAEAAAAPKEEAKPEPLPKVFRARQVEKKTMRRAVLHGIVWAGMLAIVAALLGAAALFRVDVVRLVPRTAGAYAMVGLPVNPTGLVFEKITARPSLEAGHSALVVSGQVRNIEDREVTIPAIRIEVLDSHGEAVAEHVTSAPEPHLKAGETRHFVVSLRDPPASAKDVELAFLLDRKAAQQPAAHHAAQANHAAPAAPVLRGPTTAEVPQGRTARTTEPADHPAVTEAPAAEAAAPAPAAPPAGDHH